MRKTHGAASVINYLHNPLTFFILTPFALDQSRGEPGLCGTSTLQASAACAYPKPLVHE